MIKKILRLIEPTKIGASNWIAFLVILLLAQAALIPLLPLPGKFILDRYQNSISNTNQSSETIVNNRDRPEWVESIIGYFKSFNDLPMEEFIVKVCLIIALLGLLLALLQFIEGIIAAFINKKIFKTLRQKLNEQIISRNLSYLNSKKKIDLLGRVSTDVDKIQQVVAGALPTLFKSIPTIFLTVFAMLLTDPVVTLIFLSVIPLLYGSAFSLTSRLKKTNHALRDSNNSYQEYLLQAYSFFSMTKSLRGEKHILDSLKKSNNTVLNDFTRAENTASLFYASLVLAKALIRAVVLLVGFYFIIKGRITMGDFFMFFAYLEALIYPIDEISRFNTKWTKTLVSVERIDHLLTEMKTEVETSGTFSSDKAQTNIDFKNVTFRYNDESNDIFNNFSLQLTGPQLIAIVGPSGCGKSTFMSLFNRLYQPTHGEILFNGVNLNQWHLESLRRKILFMGQESFLLSGTVLENIRLANPNCTEELAWQALEKVNADSFVQKLPDGIHTIIGESGQGLSGGQSRRLSLARGFAMPSAQVTIFDEPTAGLDPDSGHRVVEAIKDFSQTSLVLFATHRLDELNFADSVLAFSPDKPPQLLSQSNDIDQVKSHLKESEV